MIILEAVGPAYKYWREDFSRAFAKFLGKFYLVRLQTRYNGEKYAILKGIFDSAEIACVHFRCLYI